MPDEASQPIAHGRLLDILSNAGRLALLTDYRLLTLTHTEDNWYAPRLIGGESVGPFWGRL